MTLQESQIVSCKELEAQLDSLQIKYLFNKAYSRELYDKVNDWNTIYFARH